jgi:hypothetical protein
MKHIFKHNIRYLLTLILTLGIINYVWATITLGLKTTDTFVCQGETSDREIELENPDGKIIDGDITFMLFRVDENSDELIGTQTGTNPTTSFTVTMPFDKIIMRYKATATYQLEGSSIETEESEEVQIIILPDIITGAIGHSKNISGN